MDHVKNVNCVVIGDGPAGKSALINVFHEKKLMDSLVSNYWETDVCEQYSTTLKIDNEDIRFNYLDTAGQHDYYGGDLFTMLFHGADVIMLAFGVDGFIDNVEYFWMKELNRIFANKRLPPIILVGTKIDLRGEERSAPWSRWQVRFWRVANFHLKEENVAEEKSFCLLIFSYMTVSSIVPTFVHEHSFTIIIRHSVSVTVLHT